MKIRIFHRTGDKLAEVFTCEYGEITFTPDGRLMFYRPSGIPLDVSHAQAPDLAQRIAEVIWRAFGSASAVKTPAERQLSSQYLKEELRLMQTGDVAMVGHMAMEKTPFSWRRAPAEVLAMLDEAVSA